MVKLDDVVEMLLDLMESKCKGLKKRALRTAEICVLTAEYLGESKDTQADLSSAAKLCYLELMTVPPAYFTKNDEQLSKKEKKYLQRVTKASVDILRNIGEFSKIAEYISHRRDSFNSTRGLAGKNIPVESRVMAVVTKFDSILHPLNYEMPVSINLAIDTLVNNSDELDSDIVNIFFNNVLTDYDYEISTEVMLRLEDIEPDMVLRLSVRDDSDFKLYGNGTKLTEDIIEDIKGIKRYSEEGEAIVLSRESVEPYNTCPEPDLPEPLLKPEQEVESRKVIIIDDEPGVASAIQWQLRRASYNVVTYTNPLDALRNINERDVLAVISDLNMPAMKGCELIEEVSRKSKKIPCIVITGHATKVNISRLRKVSNLTRILPKPWGEDILLDTLSDIRRADRRLS